MLSHGKLCAILCDKSVHRVQNINVHINKRTVKSHSTFNHDKGKSTAGCFRSQDGSWQNGQGGERKSAKDYEDKGDTEDQCSKQLTQHNSEGSAGKICIIKN